MSHHIYYEPPHLLWATTSTEPPHLQWATTSTMSHHIYYEPPQLPHGISDLLRDFTLSQSWCSIKLTSAHFNVFLLNLISEKSISFNNKYLTVCSAFCTYVICMCFTPGLQPCVCSRVSGSLACHGHHQHHSQVSRKQQPAFLPSSIVDPKKRIGSGSATIISGKRCFGSLQNISGSVLL